MALKKTIEKIISVLLLILLFQFMTNFAFAGERLDQLEQMYEEGKITQEEYERALQTEGLRDILDETTSDIGEDPVYTDEQLEALKETPGPLDEETDDSGLEFDREGLRAFDEELTREEEAAKAEKAAREEAQKQADLEAEKKAQEERDARIRAIDTAEEREARMSEIEDTKSQLEKKYSEGKITKEEYEKEIALLDDEYVKLKALTERGTVLPKTDRSVTECIKILNTVTYKKDEVKDTLFSEERDVEAMEIAGFQVSAFDILGCGIKTGRINLWMIPYYIRYILEFVIGLAGIVSVAGIIYGGFMYVFAGVSEKKDEGKKAIIYGIAGFAMTLLAWALVNVVIALVT